MSGDKKPKMCSTSEASPSMDGEISTPPDSIPQMAGGLELHRSTDELGSMSHSCHPVHENTTEQITPRAAVVSEEPVQLDGTCTASAHDEISQDPQVQPEQHLSAGGTPMSQQQLPPYVHPQPSATFPMATGPSHFGGKDMAYPWDQIAKGGHDPGGMASGYQCTPYQEQHSQQPFMTSSAPMMIVQQQHYYKTANFHEAKGVQGPSYQQGESRLNNIKESTKDFINNFDRSSYVSTFVERYSLRTMKRLHFDGSLFIKGQHGTGKTRLGVHLLSKLSKESKRTPLVLTLASDWHLIPKTKRHSEKAQRKYIVMIDDMFGSSNFSKAFLMSGRSCST
ncbi:uncharacterized protein LOC124291332 isoform X2 [Haliotis rubra]|uniref:uncharacterized protein LOC124291332 isoform X2 n=1 Tax=Haliotis rubra TaxID=36100 RepID=UPI001EE5B7C3|nr:uncharacterized protein LOC124291332 isoform X2 [Haliotis rubra]XP_046584285.1 uncharacterized protein LOC124291332 isoform X2 [Haliotis rubra]